MKGETGTIVVATLALLIAAPAGLAAADGPAAVAARPSFHASPLDSPVLNMAAQVRADPTQPLVPLLAETIRNVVGVPAANAAPPSQSGDQYVYTYDVGDVDGDGSDDVAVDSYCADVDGCADTTNALMWTCTPTHRLHVLGGREGTALWTRELDPVHELGFWLPEDGPDVPEDVSALPVPPYPFGCVIDFVLGTVPAENGVQDLVVYRWRAVGAVAAVAIHHQVARLDARTGETRWTYDDQGVYENAFVEQLADNVFLVPILQVPPNQGVRVLPDATQPNLLLRRWGFLLAQAGIANSDLGLNHGVLDYQPRESALGLNLDTGEVLWDQTTFEPRNDRSVFPETSHGREVRGGLNTFQQTYFSGSTCCYDLTGDHVPDLLYRTYEWFPVYGVDTPLSEPKGVAARLLLYDGATGDLAWETFIVEDSGSTYFILGIDFFSIPAVGALGDVDGDDVSDFVVNLYTFDDISGGQVVNPVFTASVRRGTDAHELWNVQGPEMVASFPVGNADGATGNEVATLRYMTNTDPLKDITNFTATPLDVRAGQDGRVIWTASMHSNGFDLQLAYRNYVTNGLPDLDHDGVGDLWLDDATFASDQTAIHKFRPVSGRTGATLAELVAVGSFAFPFGGGDLDGDGHDEFLILQGDVIDLWLTAYRGADAAPLWSRRVLTLDLANTFLAQPNVRIRNVDVDPEAGRDLLVSFSLFSQDVGGSKGDGAAGAYQTVQVLRGVAGQLLWSLPEMDDPDGSLRPGRETSTVEAYYELHGRPNSANTNEAGGGLGRTPILLLAAGGLSTASLAGAYFVSGRRWFR